MVQNKYKWPLIEDNISQEDKQVLCDFIMNTNQFTNGPKVKEFESEWSKWLGIKHSCFVNSGASANYIMMSIVKEMRGVGEVIVPRIGWVSDVAPVVNLGMTPVFVDIEYNNFSMSFEKIRDAVTPETKAIVLVHAMGFNAITEKLVNFCKSRGILLIEDCCESHGATYNGQKIGTFGDISNFSFYFGHHMTTIEGGMICTNNKELDNYARLFRSHGMTREVPEIFEEYKNKYRNLNPLFTFAVPGYNMRSTELNAVLGLNQLKRLDYNIGQRTKNLKIWLSNLDSTKYFIDYDIEGSSNFALPLVKNSTTSNVNFDKVQELLDKRGVEYRVGTAGGGDQSVQPYLKNLNYKVFPRQTSNSSKASFIHRNGLYIGNHQWLREEQIIELCKELNNV